jgi:hypothetical protein
MVCLLLLLRIIGMSSEIELRMKRSVNEKFWGEIILNRTMTAEEWETFEGCAMVRRLKGGHERN